MMVKPLMGSTKSRPMESTGKTDNRPSRGKNRKTSQQVASASKSEDAELEEDDSSFDGIDVEDDDEQETEEDFDYQYEEGEDKNSDDSQQCFPNLPNSLDLYKELQIARDADIQEIRRSYRILAMKWHPDKVHKSISKKQATEKFQTIGFAYSILSDQSKRELYDNGHDPDLAAAVEGEGFEQFFKSQLSATVLSEQVARVKKDYQFSQEEINDVLAAYLKTNGRLSSIFKRVMLSNETDDHDRFIDIIEQAIEKNEIPLTETWGQERRKIENRKLPSSHEENVNDDEGRGGNFKKISPKVQMEKKHRREEKARWEAQEAEKAAKKLGVWKELFGNQTSNAADIRPDPALGVNHDNNIDDHHRNDCLDDDDDRNYEDGNSNQNVPVGDNIGAKNADSPRNSSCVNSSASHHNSPRENLTKSKRMKTKSSTSVKMSRPIPKSPSKKTTDAFQKQSKAASAEPDDHSTASLANLIKARQASRASQRADFLNSLINKYGGKNEGRGNCL